MYAWTRVAAQNFRSLTDGGHLQTWPEVTPDRSTDERLRHFQWLDA